jgi:hypothetical protein
MKQGDSSVGIRQLEGQGTTGRKESVVGTIPFSALLSGTVLSPGTLLELLLLPYGPPEHQNQSSHSRTQIHQVQVTVSAKECRESIYLKVASKAITLQPYMTIGTRTGRTPAGGDTGKLCQADKRI